MGIDNSETQNETGNVFPPIERELADPQNANAIKIKKRT